MQPFQLAWLPAEPCCTQAEPFQHQPRKQNPLEPCQLLQSIHGAAWLVGVGPTFTSVAKGTIATWTSSGLVAAFCNWVSRSCVAFFSAAILPLSAMEPVLS